MAASLAAGGPAELPAAVPVRQRRPRQLLAVNARSELHPSTSQNVVVRGLRVNTTGRPNADRIIEPASTSSSRTTSSPPATTSSPSKRAATRTAGAWRTSMNLVFRRNVLWTRFNGACVKLRGLGGRLQRLLPRDEDPPRSTASAPSPTRRSFVSDVFVRNAKAYDLQGDCVHFDSDYKGVGGDRPTQFERFLLRGVEIRGPLLSPRASGGARRRRDHRGPQPQADEPHDADHSSLTPSPSPTSATGRRPAPSTASRNALSNKATVAFRPYGDKAGVHWGAPTARDDKPGPPAGGRA